MSGEQQTKSLTWTQVSDYNAFTSSDYTTADVKNVSEIVIGAAKV